MGPPSRAEGVQVRGAAERAAVAADSGPACRCRLHVAAALVKKQLDGYYQAVT